MSRYDDDDDEQVIYVEREGGSSIKALLLGAMIGAGVALLFAPQSGEETRRGIKRRLRKVRALAEEKVDELSQRFGGENGDAGLPTEETEDDEEDLESVAAGEPARGGTAREELERRLEKARARRRKGPAEESDA
ncbi:MAG: YtxH domain-containing protein [Gemmatimonadota bacterium]